MGEYFESNIRKGSGRGLLYVLRIEVTGPVGLHLTVVDLPGLISVATKRSLAQ